MDERTTLADLERRLAESEAWRRSLIDSWAQAVWKANGDGIVVADSPSWRAYTGQTHEEWLGYGWLDAIHPDDRAYAERQWREAVAAREPVNAEFRLRAPNGGWRWTNVRAAPVLDEGGNLEKWIGINIDIDDRKRAEATLRESESRLRTLFDSIDEGYAEFDVILDEDGQVIDWRYVALNAAFTRLTGMEDVTGRLISQIVPDLKPEWGELYTRVIKTGEPIRFEQVAASLGQWYEVYASRSGGPDSRRIVVVYNDITARKRAEANLRESEERQAFLLKLSDALRALTDPIAIQEVAARILGEHLDADRTYYAVVKGDYEVAVVEREYLRGDAPSVVGTHAFAAFGSAFDAFRNGRAMVVDDLEVTDAIRSEELSGFRALSIRSMINVPLVKGDRSVAGMNVLNTTPRKWTAQQVSLVDETAERTWAAVERARAEAALGESEALRRIALDSGGMGAWRWNLRNGLIWGDASFKALYGFPPTDELMSLPQFTERMSPQSAAEIGEVVTKAIAAGEEFDGPIEIVAGPTAGRWVRWKGRPAVGDTSVFHGVTFDITEQREAEAALQESEERQAFLLKLSDTLRPLTDPIEITAQATRILGEYMQADRTFIAFMEPDGVNLDVHHEYLRPGASSVIGHHNFDAFGAFVSPRLVEGHIMAVEDVSTLALSASERAHYAAVGIAAYLLVPLVRDGRFAACFTCNHQTPRPWTEADKNIVRETADRTWAAVERARAEGALRESEERFAQFANASAGGIWIRDAAGQTMEYVSPAIGRIYGVEPGAILGGLETWAALVVPDDRATAIEHLERALHGEAAIHEFRIQRPSDGAFRWIRDTAFPLGNGGDLQRIGGIAEDITDAKLAIEHQGVLLAELQHRVRNIMALIRSITARTGERAASVLDYRDLMLGRLQAFARVQALLTRAANVSVGISALVRDEVSVQAQHEGQYDLDGPDIELSPKAAEVLTLAVHELSTNAVKYGALSTPNGKVTVTWSSFDKRGRTWLAFDWIEVGAPQRPRPATDGPKRRGFSSELIEGRVPYELKGKGTITIEPGGARCHLEFPLQSGASILETGAPQRATVFGGALDMTGEPDLSGHRILVVEDDYYLATDAARALQGAGAEVMGPCGTQEDARAELAEQRPDAVILDINLGPGPSFKLAEHLKDNGIPFVFTTGYDQDAIPAEFDNMERLEKPFQLRQVVGAAARLVGAAA